MARTQQFTIYLKTDERKLLERNCKSGDWKPCKVLRAKILLHADLTNSQDKRPMKTKEIAESLGCSTTIISNLKKRFQNERLGALEEKPRSGRPKIVDGEVEAHMIAIACSDAPEGRERWTLRLIASKLVTLVDELDDISYTTVGKALKKMNLNHG